MKKDNKLDVVIVGSGIAGITALIWCRQLGLNALLIERKHKIGGQLHLVHNRIKDFPGVNGLTGKEWVEQLEDQMHENKDYILFGQEVIRVEVLEKEGVIIHYRSPTDRKHQGIGSVLYSSKLIMATGVQDRKLHVPGEERISPLSTSKDSYLFKDKRVLIIGGGDRALEGANRLKNLAEKVILVHRHNRFKARKEYLEAVRGHERIDICTHTIVESFHSKEDKKKVLLRNLESNRLEKVEVDHVLIRIGIVPNISLVRDIVNCTDTHIKVDRYGQTTCADIYAIGDITNIAAYSSISKCVGEGMVVAKHIWMRLHNEIAL
ncbi:NAD(P)/FAD-dependent oxidoreductase [Caldalkalibacillus mannanilyticus]|uniref:NAD(P)/FAD-dependent oxidoreductase n=1 Tax=Caldalkalibacillus mannanilyticus TaxID=1418 RepID=UPI000469A8FE|nr:NAD(P)/FAD-dependent oxidoreductase [Caldalkalibacillus mannanilyticus]